MTAAIAYSTPAISRSQIVEKPCLLNLLIFSQDRALCHAYNEAASALGYTAATSGTAEQALYLIDSQKVDVVLLDKNPPAAHELEMLQKIKSRHPEIEVIVATSYGTVDSAVQAMKAGVYDYLTKPFGLADLKLVLEKVAAHLRVKTETRPDLSRTRPVKVLAESSAEPQKWRSYIGSFPKPLRSHILS